MTNPKAAQPTKYSVIFMSFDLIPSKNRAVETFDTEKDGLTFRKGWRLCESYSKNGLNPITNCRGNYRYIKSKKDVLNIILPREKGVS